MSTTVSFNHYEFQGQVYSPAFSEPSSPMSTTSSSASTSNPPSPQLKRREFHDSDEKDLCEFKSKVPKFANKYEEMLQPLTPVTILSSERPMPKRTCKSDYDPKLQRQFNDLVSMAGHEEVEDFLVQHLSNVDVNQFNSEGHTALQQSCLEGNLPLAKVLVKYGANLHLCTRDGFSTLHLAVFSGHSHLMSYILSLQ